MASKVFQPLYSVYATEIGMASLTTKNQNKIMINNSGQKCSVDVQAYISIAQDELATTKNATGTLDSDSWPHKTDGYRTARHR